MQLENVWKQNVNINDRLRSLETAFLNQCRSKQRVRATFDGATQPTPDHVGSEAGSSPGLTSLAYEMHGTWSLVSRFAVLLEHLEKSTKGLRTSDRSLQLKKDWLELSHNEYRLGDHTQACKLDQNQLWDKHMHQRQIQLCSEESFRMLYGTAGHSKYGTSSVEEIVGRANCHIAALNKCKQLLPSSLFWEGVDSLSLDVSVGQVCSYYSRAYSMALLPYLNTASKRSVLHTTAETASLNASERRLIDIASECVSAAFRCVEVSAGLSSPTIHECGACKVDRGHAIHE